MELGRLEKYKHKYKSFDRQITSLQGYLNNQTAYSNKVLIIPEKVAKALELPELDVIFILSLAEKENILKKKFLVFTKDHQFLLGEFYNSNIIPNEIYNKDTGKEVDEDNYYIDLVYEVASA